MFVKRPRLLPRTPSFRTFTVGNRTVGNRTVGNSTVGILMTHQTLRFGDIHCGLTKLFVRPGAVLSLFSQLKLAKTDV